MSFLKKWYRKRKEQHLRNRVGDELDTIRANFRVMCHTQLDDVLDDLNEYGTPTIDLMIAAATRFGYAIVITVYAQEPPSEPETEIESQAKESGIEIVRA